MKDQYVNDIVITAVEGGGFYWARSTDARLVQPAANADTWYYALPFNLVDDDGKRHEITREIVERGIKLRAGAKGMTVEAFVENHDAYDADDAIQMGLFGDLVYG